MTPTLTPLLQVQNLCFAHPGQAPLALGWSASVGAGVTLLFGDTGSGKTTLLRLLAGTLAGEGVLSVAGVHLHHDAAAYRRSVFWFDPAVAAPAGDALTPGEHAAALRAAHPNFNAAAWQRHANAFGLGPHWHKPLYQLSTGSKRKVWLAAALASGCPLTLLDEPAGALDGPSAAYLKHALADLADEPHRAVLVASTERLAGVPLAGVIELPLAGVGAS